MLHLFVDSFLSHWSKLSTFHRSTLSTLLSLSGWRELTKKNQVLSDEIEAYYGKSISRQGMRQFFGQRQEERGHEGRIRTSFAQCLCFIHGRNERNSDALPEVMTKCGTRDDKKEEKKGDMGSNITSSKQLLLQWNGCYFPPTRVDVALLLSCLACRLSHCHRSYLRRAKRGTLMAETQDQGKGKGNGYYPFLASSWLGKDRCDASNDVLPPRPPSGFLPLGYILCSSQVPCHSKEMHHGIEQRKHTKKTYWEPCCVETQHKGRRHKGRGKPWPIFASVSGRYPRISWWSPRLGHSGVELPWNQTDWTKENIPRTAGSLLLFGHHQQSNKTQVPCSFHLEEGGARVLD